MIRSKWIPWLLLNAIFMRQLRTQASCQYGQVGKAYSMDRWLKRLFMGNRTYGVSMVEIAIDRPSRCLLVVVTKMGYVKVGHE